MTRCSRQAAARSVVSVVLASCMAGCGLSSPPPTPIATPLHRVVKVDNRDTSDGVISYVTQRGSPAHEGSVEDAVEIRTRSDLDELRGAPEDFREFLVTQLAERAEDVDRYVDKYLTPRGLTVASAGCDFKVEIRVWGIAEEVATGRERACGLESNDVIWTKENGSWRRASRMQGGWDCSELERYRVPADITAAVCWYDGWKTRAYDGPRS